MGEPQEGSAGSRVPRLERAVSSVLRAGVVTSSLVISAGAALTLVSSSSLPSARRALPQLRRGVLHPAGFHLPHTVSSVITGVAHGKGPALVMLGILLLIATPVLRVAVSVVGFALDRDRIFMLVTLAVLVVLIGSFAVGA